MSDEYFRLCPTCGSESPAETLRCTCGALLTGVDVSKRGEALPQVSPQPLPALASNAIVCAHADCAQTNPAGSTDCRYCNRPLAPPPTTLFSLPAALRENYRILRALPATGMEAELLIVEALAGGEPLIAKIYRHGIHPKAEVQQRIARIGREHRVDIVAYGDADGFAYELMEYCRLGSLRDVLRNDQGMALRLPEIIGELAAALAAVHEAGLIHRDLKPENILLRQLQPLDLILTDFGIASVNDATVLFTGHARTLAYAAPESLSGVIDEKSDYWSLGMLLLEIALARHPFAGLSDAVILHRLTTRSMDLSPLADERLRMLLRGLLLRDPKQRWGRSELTRWLGADASLQVPQEAPGDVPTHAPYRLGSEDCLTPEQLGIALARNWQMGIADMDNGLLIAWFRNELKNQNLVRFLIELNLERELHADTRLLRLILHLAPGIPPVWCGDSVGLPSILAHADRALRGDDKASDWLDSVYRHAVLETYAAAGNAEAGDLLSRWQQAAANFAGAWETMLAQLQARKPPRDPQQPALFDDLVYGHHSGPSRPALRTQHPRLLALAYDESWEKRLRQKLAAEFAELAGLAAASSASLNLVELGDPLRVEPYHLLVMEALLPETRKRARLDGDRRAQILQAEIQEWNLLKAEALSVCERLRKAATPPVFTSAASAQLRAAIDDFFSLEARVRAIGQHDESALQLRNSLLRIEPVANRLLILCDQLLERQTVNAGWFSERGLGFAALALFLLPLFFGQRLLLPLLGGVLAIAAWRFLPAYTIGRQIRRLARTLEPRFA